MSERMTDERFVVIDTNVRMPGMCTSIDWEAIGAELWDALKAERAKVAELESTVEGLASHLEDAIEDIGCWAGYASEYFQYKYDLAGMIKAYQDVLAALKPKENRDE